LVVRQVRCSTTKHDGHRRRSFLPQAESPTVTSTPAGDPPDLTRAKLVSRTSLAGDRRSNQLALTTKGAKALQQGSVRAREVEDAITEEMDPSRLSALKMSLLELLERSDAP